MYYTVQIPSCFWPLIMRDHSIADTIAWLHFFVLVPPPEKICITPCQGFIHLDIVH